MRMPKFQEMRPTTGAYVCFYCENCGASIASQPDVGGALGTQLKNSLLRQIPIVGGFLAGTAQPIDRDAHWKQVEQQFGECQQCSKVVCRGCFDGRQNKCTHCRVAEAADATAKKMGDAATGVAAAMAGALGSIGGLAHMAMIECPSCKKQTLRAPNCQQCGQPIPESVFKGGRCSKCGSGMMPGTKFCAKCGGAAA